MNRIREIQEQLKRIYASQATAADSGLPSSIESLQLRAFAKSYATAAALVSNGSPQLWLVALQLAGQSVELALKACIAVAGVKPPKHHNLVEFYCLATANGFELSELQQAFVVHLEHFYSRDLATETRFKTRYPANAQERLGGAVPDISAFVDIVDSLCKQAEEHGAKNA